MRNHLSLAEVYTALDAEGVALARVPTGLAVIGVPSFLLRSALIFHRAVLISVLPEWQTAPIRPWAELWQCPTCGSERTAWGHWRCDCRPCCICGRPSGSTCLATCLGCGMCLTGSK